jgi:pyridinium-3,5-biscarboxylic acid mononucleotide synthase
VRVDRTELHALLQQVADGTTPADAAVDRLVAGPFGADAAGQVDLGFARVDTHRRLRTGDPEVVYGAGKTAEQTVAIVAALLAAGSDRPVLVTRCPADSIEAIRSHWPEALVDGSTVVVGALPEPIGTVAVVAAGTSDQAVAAEAALTVQAFGAGVEVITDVGVAGLHRLLAVRGRLDAADCLIVLAGMEGALPSVVGGLVGTPLVAVPTSVGYGASFGGLAALLAMLNSCAPGVVVCNIDNGFGAGVFAARVARRAGSAG